MALQDQLEAPLDFNLITRNSARAVVRPELSKVAVHGYVLLARADLAGI